MWKMGGFIICVNYQTQISKTMLQKILSQPLGKKGFFIIELIIETSSERFVEQHLPDPA